LVLVFGEPARHVVQFVEGVASRREIDAIESIEAIDTIEAIRNATHAAVKADLRPSS